MNLYTSTLATQRLFLLAKTVATWEAFFPKEACYSWRFWEAVQLGTPPRIVGRKLDNSRLLRAVFDELRREWLRIAR